MGMAQNWKLFIDKCRSKSKSHSKTAHCWSMTHNALTLIMIFLSAITAGTALISSIPKIALAGIGAVATVVSSIASFLQAAKKSAVHEEAAKHYQWLMLEMAHCETEKKYDTLWMDFNKYVLKEPSVVVCFRESTEMSWTMTPELTQVAKVKDSGEEITPVASVVVDSRPHAGGDLGDGIDEQGKDSLEDSLGTSPPFTRKDGYQKLPTLE